MYDANFLLLVQEKSQHYHIVQRKKEYFHSFCIALGVIVQQQIFNQLIYECFLHHYETFL